MMAVLFISHSAKDRESAEHLRDRLKASDFHSFFLDFDPDSGIGGGSDWERELYKHLLNCNAVVFLCSPKACSSKWCFAELSMARALGRPILPVRLSNCDLPDILRSIQAIDLWKNVEAGYERLCSDLRRLGLSDEGEFAFDARRPPFPGMSPFDESDAAMFFGRFKEISALTALLRQTRLAESGLVLVLGSSGSGKSSLVRSGLIPRLKRNREEWLALNAVNASAGMLQEIAQQLALLAKTPSESLDFLPFFNAIKAASRRTQHLERSKFSILLRQLAVTLGSPATRVVCVIDQAERLLPENGASCSELQFISNCARSIGLPFRLILTLRSDCFDGLKNNASWKDVPFETLLLPQLSADRFAEIIEKPARRAGLEIESGLVQAMVQDAANEDALPLLAFALRELWERYGKHSGKLSLQDYLDGLGRLEGCIGRKAKSVLDSLRLDSAALILLAGTFSRMARLGDHDALLSRPIEWSSVPQLLQPVMRRLIDERLLVRSTDGRRLEVVHDVLFRAWDDLRRWLEEDRQFLAWKRGLEVLVADWQKRGCNIEQVHLSGASAREARHWLETRPSSLEEAEGAFISQSLERIRQEEERWQRAYQVSVVRQLAAQAQAIVNTESADLTERAVLLGAEALRRCAELGITSLEVDQALRQTLAIAARCLVKVEALGTVSSHAISVHSGSGVVAFGDEEGRTFLWSIARGTLLNGPRLNASVTWVEISPSGKWLAAGDQIGSLTLLEIEKETRVDLKGTKSPIRAIAFSPNSRFLAAAFNATVLIWDVETSEAPVELKSEAADESPATPVVSLSFSPDSSILLTQQAGGSTRAWRWASKGLLSEVPTRGNYVTHSADGRFFGVSAGGLPFIAYVWDIFLAEERILARNCARLKFSNDGRLAAIASPEHFAQIWELPLFHSAHRMRHNAEVWDLDFSPDSSRLLTVAKNGVVHIWDTPTGQELARIIQHGVTWARYLDANRRILTCAGQRRFTLWDTENLSAFARWDNPVAILGVAFSDDGRFIASLARQSPSERTPILTEIKTGQIVRTVEVGSGTIPGSEYARQLLDRHVERCKAGVSRSGTFATEVAGSLVRVYKQNKADRVLISSLQHDRSVFRTVFSPDEKFLLTASDHDTARIWEILTGQEVSRLTHRNPNITDADFSPDGAWVATASWDCSVRLWKWRQDDLIQESASRVSRNLSADEWARYLPNEPYRPSFKFDPRRANSYPRALVAQFQ